MPDQGVARDDLIAYLDKLLDSPSFADYGPNGLQVEGKDRIRKVVTGVSACLQLFERAAAANADAVLVHHGLFWKGLPLEITGIKYRRIEHLIRHDINLIGYHLPLDAHHEFGNNALGLRRLGCGDLQPFADWDGRTIGFKGRLEETIGADELEGRCQEVFGVKPLIIRGGPDAVETISMVSGGGSKALYDAIDEGLDAFITGEPTEWVMNVAQEAGIHFVAAGHYHTEILGVRTLGKHIAERFGIEVQFIDVPNPV